MSLTAHLYTDELTANVLKPWMNYVNNGLKQIFDSLTSMRFYLLLPIIAAGVASCNKIR